MDLTCPKCHGAMRTYERNGVHVDQCTECRGIFLDRGELDRLIDAENQWHGAAKPGAEGPGRDSGHDPRYEEHSSGAGLGAVVGEVLSQVRGQKHGGSPSGYGQQHSGRRPRKKESFVSDLFG